MNIEPRKTVINKPARSFETTWDLSCDLLSEDGSMTPILQVRTAYAKDYREYTSTAYYMEEGERFTVWASGWPSVTIYRVRGVQRYSFRELEGMHRDALFALMDKPVSEGVLRRTVLDALVYAPVTVSA